MSRNFFYKIIFYLIIYSACNYPVAAQFLQPKFQHLPGSERITAVFFRNIVQDKNGYLWMSSGSGLVKYDGYDFNIYRYNPYDSNSISQNVIYNLFIDNDDGLWMGTPEGLCTYDRITGKFKRFSEKKDGSVPELRNVSSIAEDNDGLMWVGNYEDSLWTFDRKLETFTRVHYDTAYISFQKGKDDFHNKIYRIIVDSRNRIWIGTNTGLYLIHKEKNSQSKPYKIRHFDAERSDSTTLLDNTVIDLMEDHNGLIWILSLYGLHSLDPQTEIVKRVFQASEIAGYKAETLFAIGLVLTEDASKNIWFGYRDVLFYIDSSRLTVTRFTDNINPASKTKDYILSLEFDVGNNLVVASSSGLKILNLNPHAFHNWKPPVSRAPSLEPDVVSIYEDEQQNVWIGTFENGLKKWDRKKGNIVSFEAGIKGGLARNTIFSIIADKQQKLWIANGEYLSHFKDDGKTFENINTNERKLSEVDARTIYSMCIDKEGLLWLGTGNGIKRFDPRTKELQHFFYEPSNDEGLSDFTAQAIFADSRDNIWVGTGSIAFNRFDKSSGKFTHYKTNAADTNSISSNMVNWVTEDENGYIWIGTFGGGLCRFDYNTNKFSTYNRTRGLNASNVFSIAEDKNGHLWLGTESGIIKFNPTTGQFNHFDQQDGLVSDYVVGGYRPKGSAFVSKNGLIYMGGKNGLNYFHPDSIILNTYIPPVVITSFKLFDKVQAGWNEKKEIVLDYNQNFFSFEFSALNYTNTAKNEYAYQLEGFDPEWVYCSHRRYTGYTNLDPGEYTFKVKASNNDGIWNEKGYAVKIIILPPWWRTYWAYAIYGLLFIGGILVADRYQRQRLLAKEREKNREIALKQAQEIEKAYHTLKTTQAQLIQSEKMASLGELTAGIAHEIQNPLNFVNNFSEVNKELLQELKGEIGKGNIDDAKSLADDVIENEEKINHHGRRADAIVKNMLQHSRAATGDKEPTDINALADEYLRLAYHGFRSRDKNFNASTVTNFDENIGKVSVVPQDIGRVLLNLFNNAFYSVSAKAKQLSDITHEESATADAVAEKKKTNPGFIPEINVSTKNDNGMVKIIVRDNGNGIPVQLLDKIFQPFFTTKPTGQGTGLGLSLSYDIIKAHQGEIQINNNPGEGVEFVISLPGK